MEALALLPYLSGAVPCNLSSAPPLSRLSALTKVINSLLFPESLKLHPPGFPPASLAPLQFLFRSMFLSWSVPQNPVSGSPLCSIPSAFDFGCHPNASGAQTFTSPASSRAPRPTACLTSPCCLSAPRPESSEGTFSLTS